MEFGWKYPETCFAWQPSIFTSLLGQIEAFAEKIDPILIIGERGTGKELLARQIHQQSSRKNSPFIPVNCRILKGDLLVQQLIGQNSGFCASNQATGGCIKAAQGGTLYFGAVDQLDSSDQLWLLERIVTRQNKIRFIFGSEVNLRDQVEEGAFIPDLYFAINFLNINIPPLRQTPDDILILSNYFLSSLGEFYIREKKSFNSETAEVLLGYHWPHNIQELAYAMRHAFSLSSSNEIKTCDLPREVLQGSRKVQEHQSSDMTLDSHNRSLIQRALETCKGRKMAAAKMLGIDHRRLTRLMDKYHIDLK